MLGISLTPILCIMDHFSVCPSAHPSIHPSLWVPLSIHIHLCSFGQAAAWLGWGACLGGMIPIFLTREGQGGDAGFASSQELPPHLPQRPGVSPARNFGKSSPVVRVHAGSVHLLLQNVFPYLYVRGMGLVAFL